jgi:hypothetical protein
MRFEHRLQSPGRNATLARLFLYVLKVWSYFT